MALFLLTFDIRFYAKSNAMNWTFETIAMFSALFFMFASIIAKVLTIRLIIHMKQSVKDVQMEKSHLMNQLKNAAAQRAVGERNKIAAERKLAKREKKMRDLRRELNNHQEESQRRETKRDDVKKQLIR